MKFLRLFLLFVIITSPPVSALSFDGKELNSGNSTVWSDSVNIRKSPALSAEVIGRLQPGDTVGIVQKTDVFQRIDDQGDFWYRVHWKNSEGYVWGGFLADESFLKDLDNDGKVEAVVHKVFAFEFDLPEETSSEQIADWFPDPDKRQLFQSFYNKWHDDEPLSLDRNKLNECFERGYLPNKTFWDLVSLLQKKPDSVRSDWHHFCRFRSILGVWREKKKLSEEIGESTARVEAFNVYEKTLFKPAAVFFGITTRRTELLPCPIVEEKVFYFRESSLKEVLTFFHENGGEDGAVQSKLYFFDQFRKGSGAALISSVSVSKGWKAKGLECHLWTGKEFIRDEAVSTGDQWENEPSIEAPSLTEIPTRANTEYTSSGLPWLEISIGKREPVAGVNRFLNLRSLPQTETNKNLSFGKSAFSSDEDDPKNPPANPIFGNGSWTSSRDPLSWYFVDLGESYPIDRIETDLAFTGTNSPKVQTVFIVSDNLEAPWLRVKEETSTVGTPNSLANSRTIQFAQPVTGRYVGFFAVDWKGARAILSKFAVFKAENGK